MRFYRDQNQEPPVVQENNIMPWEEQQLHIGHDPQEAPDFDLGGEI